MYALLFVDIDVVHRFMYSFELSTYMADLQDCIQTEDLCSSPIKVYRPQASV